MKTDWLSDAEQKESDEAHDACARAVDALTSEYKLACQRHARARDRVEALILTRAAARVGCEVSALQPVRDSSGVMIGVVVPAGAGAKPTATT